MDIIKFPGATKSVTADDSNSSKKMFMGAIEITCKHCKTVAKLEPSNMIFKSLEYYCIKCGNPFIVTNPAFSKKI